MTIVTIIIGKRTNLSLPVPTNRLFPFVKQPRINLYSSSLSHFRHSDKKMHEMRLSLFPNLALSTHMILTNVSLVYSSDNKQRLTVLFKVKVVVMPTSGFRHGDFSAPFSNRHLNSLVVVCSFRVPSSLI